MPSKSQIAGALIASFLLFLGWLIHDLISLPPNCRDSLRRLMSDDAGIMCPYNGQRIYLIDVGDGKQGTLCQCPRGDDTPRIGHAL